MSNILIIKHGALGDLIQANGAIEDIKKSNVKSNVVLLTSYQYHDFMIKCPYVDEVIVDKRLPRWNLIYLYKLKKKLTSYNFTHVFDLQNSSRTKFYNKYLINFAIWSSTETTLEHGQLKSDFDEEPVLKRMEIQLKKSGIKTKNVKKSNLNWAVSDISHITKNYLKKNIF
jgi:ADP-heptose:LPS heptosyltransferase